MNDPDVQVRLDNLVKQVLNDPNYLRKVRDVRIDGRELRRNEFTRLEGVADERGEADGGGGG